MASWFRGLKTWQKWAAGFVVVGIVGSIFSGGVERQVYALFGFLGILLLLAGLLPIRVLPGFLRGRPRKERRAMWVSGLIIVLIAGAFTPSDDESQQEVASNESRAATTATTSESRAATTTEAPLATLGDAAPADATTIPLIESTTSTNASPTAPTATAAATTSTTGATSTTAAVTTTVAPTTTSTTTTTTTTAAPITTTTTTTAAPTTTTTTTTAAPTTTTTTTTAAPTTTTTTTTATTTIPPNPGDSKNCSDFSTHNQAQVWFNTYFPYYGDVARLDGNDDGVACESLL